MMNDTIQQIILSTKYQRKNEKFPDHICAQSNVIMMRAGKVASAANSIKYDLNSEEFSEWYKTKIITIRFRYNISRKLLFW